MMTDYLEEQDISYCALVNSKSCESFQSLWGIELADPANIIDLGNIPENLTIDQYVKIFGYNKNYPEVYLKAYYYYLETIPTTRKRLGFHSDILDDETKDSIFKFSSSIHDWFKEND